MAVLRQHSGDCPGALGFYVSALVNLGELERANNWARRAVVFHPDNLRLKYNLASAFAEAADAKKALPLLEDVVMGMSGGWLRWVNDDNSFDPIRGDPDFTSLMEKARVRFQSEQD